MRSLQFDPLSGIEMNSVYNNWVVMGLDLEAIKSNTGYSINVLSSMDLYKNHPAKNYFYDLSFNEKVSNQFMTFLGIDYHNLPGSEFSPIIEVANFKD